MWTLLLQKEIEVIIESRYLNVFKEGSYEQKVSLAKKALIESSGLFKKGSKVSVVSTFAKNMVVVDEAGTFWSVLLGEDSGKLVAVKADLIEGFPVSMSEKDVVIGSIDEAVERLVDGSDCPNVTAIMRNIDLVPIQKVLEDRLEYAVGNSGYWLSYYKDNERNIARAARGSVKIEDVSLKGVLSKVKSLNEEAADIIVIDDAKLEVAISSVQEDISSLETWLEGLDGLDELDETISQAIGSTVDVVEKMNSFVSFAKKTAVK